VISLRHPEFASLGALNLARLHRDRGKKDSAKAAYERAIAVGPPEVAGTAAKEHAALLEEVGAQTSREGLIEGPWITGRRRMFRSE
jgi:hypothetical protein